MSKQNPSKVSIKNSITKRIFIIKISAFALVLLGVICLYFLDQKEFAEFEQSSQAESKTILLSSLTFNDLFFGSWFILVMSIASVVTYRIVTEIEKKLHELSKQAASFSITNDVVVSYTNQEDEIGILARSLNEMMSENQANGQELAAQNEELQAQQEEMNDMLFNMEENKKLLESRNAFIQSLAYTLDRKILLKSIISNIVPIMKADKGIIMLLNHELDYAVCGITDKGAKQFQETFYDGMFVRLVEQRKPYVSERYSTATENGYHLNNTAVSDLCIPVENSNGKLMACIVLTYFGKVVNEKTEELAVAMAKQISLSLGKIELYEETERQRQMIQDILNTIQEGIQLVNNDGQTIQVNSKWCEMMRTTETLCLSEWCDISERVKHADEWKREDFYTQLIGLVKDSEPLIQFIDEVIEGNNINQSIVYEMESSHSYVRMYYEPLYQGNERVGTLFVHRDITKEYEADQVKSEFVSTVSHELRTPLASVLGFAELLLYKELSPERQKKYFMTIHQEARRLTTLINDFLDLQRMESGKQTYDFKIVNLTEIVNEVLELQKVNTTIHTLEFISTVRHSEIRADTDRLKQVLMNLVGNAIKYSPDGGKVLITCLEEGNMLRLQIADEGLGIPEEDLSKLFSRFYRVDNSDRRTIGGTGLGLAIVKEIMEVHSGNVYVSSVYGKGSTFTLTFPSITSDEEERDLYEGYRVYIVEDDVSLSELLKEELVTSGYSVAQFVRGEDVLVAMHREVPDALVLDLNLADDMDGWDVIEIMKEDDALRDVPIIISSAFEEQERASKLGTRGYLVKPYRPHKLSEAIVQIIDDRHGQILISKEN